MTHLQLYQHVRALARTDLNVLLTKHTKYDRMKGRRVTRAEIVRCLQMGTMTRAAEPGKYHDELKCRLDYHDNERKPFGVEVAVSDSEPDLIVITVIRYA